MKLEYVFLGTVLLAIGGMILTWMGPEGAVVVNVVSRCVDSDNGNNVLERGFVELPQYFAEDYCDMGGQKVDSCRGRGCTIVENYCRLGKAVSIQKPCPRYAFVCNKGRCVEPGDLVEDWRTLKRPAIV